MPVPIISVAAMREWEQASWATGRSETEVIAQVGRIVAERALELTKVGERILLLAGKGHNGDDVRQAQPHLANRDVTLVNISDPVASLTEVTAVLAGKPALIIDGIFGIGLNRPLEEGWIRLVSAVNEAKRLVLAVDVPSGLNAETGEVMGVAIRATVTLTLGAPKSGLLSPQAVASVGRLEVAPEIGLIPYSGRSELQWTLSADFAEYPPVREVSGHKGTYGHLVIVAGSLGYHGAAVLSARGAARAMPGLVSLLTPENVYFPIASQLATTMVHPLRWNHPMLEKGSALLAGPGLASEELPPETGRKIDQLWRTSPAPMVVDASALEWLQAGRVLFPAARVITPHPGEAARMLRLTVAEVQNHRVRTVRELSRRFGGCWVVLKGHQTLVGQSTGEIWVNSSGNPGLAQGGSGDVLAGYLGGLLAQPALAGENIGRTICYAVWQHGAAADGLTGRQKTWTVEDLLGALGRQ